MHGHPRAHESLTRAIGVSIVVTAATACMDDLKPSSFTGGWSQPMPSAHDPEGVDNDGIIPGLPVSELDLYVDWREGHDPAEPCPEEMALVANEFCIDRWEGSLVEILSSGVRTFPPTHRVEDRLVRAVSRPGVMPQGYISGAEAQRACQMAGKRLCNDDEWWRACAGSKGTIYPYGTMHVPRACNEERPLHPVIELYGADAGPKIWWVEPMNNPAINEQPATVAVTGVRRKCRTEDGLFDMVGNVHEWTNDPAGTFHGGAYSGKIALGCQYITTAHGFSYHDYSTGFRCCSDRYEPTGP